MSDKKIAGHLSDQTDHKISRGSVIRYFETHEEIEKQVSEKSSAAYGVLGTWYLTPYGDLLLVDVMREQKTPGPGR